MIQLNVDKNFSDTSYEKAVTLIFKEIQAESLNFKKYMDNSKCWYECEATFTQCWWLCSLF